MTHRWLRRQQRCLASVLSLCVASTMTTLTSHGRRCCCCRCQVRVCSNSCLPDREKEREIETVRAAVAIFGSIIFHNLRWCRKRAKYTYTYTHTPTHSMPSLQSCCPYILFLYLLSPSPTLSQSLIRSLSLPVLPKHISTQARNKRRKNNNNKHDGNGNYESWFSPQCSPAAAHRIVPLSLPLSLCSTPSSICLLRIRFFFFFFFVLRLSVVTLCLLLLLLWLSVCLSVSLSVYLWFLIVAAFHSS